MRPVQVAVLAAAVAAGTFLVRFWVPARASLPGDLHLWEWPQCLGLLVLGVYGSRRGLLRSVPDAVRRGSGWAVVVAGSTLPVVAAATGVQDVTSRLTPYLGGWGWSALYAAAVEGVLVVGGSLWLLGTAQRRFTARAPSRRSPPGPRSPPTSCRARCCWSWRSRLDRCLFQRW